jgi:hypothetical protein
MHVQGKGAMSDMYKAMISMFDPVSESKVKLDTAPCLPDPYEPNWKIYDEISTVKPAHAVTSIKLSPVLKDHPSLYCHRKFHTKRTSFKSSPVL